MIFRAIVNTTALTFGIVSIALSVINNTNFRYLLFAIGLIFMFIHESLSYYTKITSKIYHYTIDNKTRIQRTLLLIISATLLSISIKNIYSSDSVYIIIISILLILIREFMKYPKFNLIGLDNGTRN